MTSSSSLFRPLMCGVSNLSHRIVMAPLTRVRGTDTFACGPTAAQYYSERATRGGLLISEGTPISPETQYEYAAGIYTDEQESAWKRVVNAVHAKGGLISAQLWHLGRMCHGSWSENAFLRSLGRPLPSVSASATTVPGASRDYRGNKAPYPPARALTAEDIYTRLVDDYAQAARRAKRAGFDMVEIHAAHGYLFDQFFCSSTNLRTDEFGAQNVENRTRALGLVLRAVIAEMGTSGRVGIRISPQTDAFAYQGCKDATPAQTYPAIVQWLDQFDLGYLLISEPRWNGGRGNSDLESDQTYNLPVRCAWVKSVYRGVVIGSSSFTPDSASCAVSEGTYDAVAFGRLFISNPDLVDRIRDGRRLLNLYDTSTFYIRDDLKGYVDYPVFDKSEGFPRLDWTKIGTKQPAPRPKL